MLEANYGLQNLNEEVSKNENVPPGRATLIRKGANFNLISQFLREIIHSLHLSWGLF